MVTGRVWNEPGWRMFGLMYPESVGPYRIVRATGGATPMVLKGVESYVETAAALAALVALIWLPV